MRVAKEIPAAELDLVIGQFVEDFQSIIRVQVEHAVRKALGRGRSLPVAVKRARKSSMQQPQQALLIPAESSEAPRKRVASEKRVASKKPRAKQPVSEKSAASQKPLSKQKPSQKGGRGRARSGAAPHPDQLSLF